MNEIPFFPPAGDFTVGGQGTAPPTGQHETLLPARGHAKGPDPRAWRGESRLAPRKDFTQAEGALLPSKMEG